MEGIGRCSHEQLGSLLSIKGQVPPQSMCFDSEGQEVVLPDRTHPHPNSCPPPRGGLTTCIPPPPFFLPYSLPPSTCHNLEIKPPLHGSQEPTCHCRRHGRHGFDPWVGKIPWRRKWQPTLVSLPRESYGQRSLAGYGPWGRRVRHDSAQHVHN